MQKVDERAEAYIHIYSAIPVLSSQCVPDVPRTCQKPDAMLVNLQPWAVGLCRLTIQTIQ